jgi:hypothetical protein
VNCSFFVNFSGQSFKPPTHEAHQKMAGMQPWAIEMQY